jgi:hypothetical protein
MAVLASFNKRSNFLKTTKLSLLLGMAITIFLVMQAGTVGLSYSQALGTTINLTSNPQNISSYVPSIAVSGINVYVVTTDFNSSSSPSPKGEIMLTRSTNDGSTFGSSINLSNNPGQSLLPSIATAGNNVYVVWFDDSTGSYQLMFTKSNNDGVTYLLMELMEKIKFIFAAEVERPDPVES